MKKYYIKPETTLLDIMPNTSILEISEIPIVDDENHGSFDAKGLSYPQENDFDDILSEMDFDF